MFTPLAPDKDEPARLLAAVLDVVTVDPLAATDVSVWPAVKLLSWLSLIAFACLVVDC